MNACHGNDAVLDATNAVPMKDTPVVRRRVRRLAVTADLDPAKNVANIAAAPAKKASLGTDTETAFRADFVQANGKKGGIAKGTRCGQMPPAFHRLPVKNRIAAEKNCRDIVPCIVRLAAAYAKPAT